jgi:hypothetical protein
MRIPWKALAKLVACSFVVLVCSLFLLVREANVGAFPRSKLLFAMIAVALVESVGLTIGFFFIGVRERRKIISQSTNNSARR